MDVKTFIVDEVYENLRSSLLSTGRGRPTNLVADIAVNNKLLIQLAYLKDEGGKSRETIYKWLVKLVPEVAEMECAATHFSNLVESTRKTFLSIQGPGREAFLQRPVDLNFISESLSAVGITRKTFQTPPDECHESKPISHQVIIDLEQFRKSQGLPRKTALDWLYKLGAYDSPRLDRAVDSVLKTYTKLVQNKHRNPSAYEEFLKSQFCPPLSPQSAPHSASGPHSASVPSPPPKHCTTCPQLQLQLDATKSALCDLQAVNKSLLSQIEQGQAKVSSLGAKIISLEDKVKVLGRKLTQQAALKKAKVRKVKTWARQLAEEKKGREEVLATVRKLNNNVKRHKNRCSALCKENEELRKQCATLQNTTTVELR